jgi:LacI family repressor for deo operon, udp, cdd, tsx, nupC, and nupG
LRYLLFPRQDETVSTDCQQPHWFLLGGPTGAARPTELDPMSRPARPAATMRDVAHHAGVSLATVSRSLASPDQVSPETLSRIARAVRDLNYTVNANARSLRRRSSGTVLVLLPNIGNPFFSVLLQGIEETARDTGRVVLVGDTGRNREAAEGYARSLATQRPDGIILLSGFLPFAGANRRGSSSAPHRALVAVSERIPGSRIPFVGIDNVRAAREAVVHLLELGHRRIAHIRGPEGNILTLERAQGYREALSSAGIGYDDGLMRPGDFSIAAARRAMAQLLHVEPRPTAVFASNDESAIGAILEIKAAGLHVPEDISVVGFDDIEFAGVFDPPITTIRQPRRDMGRNAMQVIASLVDGRPSAPEILLPHTLLRRGSTAPAAGTPRSRV